MKPCIKLILALLISSSLTGCISLLWIPIANPGPLGGQRPREQQLKRAFGIEKFEQATEEDIRGAILRNLPKGSSRQDVRAYITEIERRKLVVHDSKVQEGNGNIGWEFTDPWWWNIRFIFKGDALEDVKVLKIVMGF